MIAKSKCEAHRLWLPVDSGTLATVFREVVPPTTELNVVDVRVLPQINARVQFIQGLKNARYFTAPEIFSQPVQHSPPVSSNRYNDAKLWRFLAEQA